MAQESLNTTQHLLVLLSLILGLGIRELLIGFRNTVETSTVRGGPPIDPLPIMAGALIFVAIVQFWWFLFFVAGLQSWGRNFFLFLSALARPVLLFVSAASVFAPVGDLETANDHYFRNRGLIYWPLVLFEIYNVAELMRYVPSGSRAAIGFHFAFIGAAVALAVTRSVRFHRWCVPVVFVLLVFFIALFSLSLH